MASTEDTYEEQVYVIKDCPVCKAKSGMKMVKSDYDRWMGGALIQDVLTKNTPAEREVLISGTCSSCFDRLFPPDEDLF